MIFYVNALGYLLTGDRYGIFLMQIVNLTAECLIVYRLARFWLRSGASLGVVAAYLFVYVGTVQDGNMTEEWSQLFLLLPLCLSLRFLKSGRSVSGHPKWYSLVYGVCLGVLLMFRVTNAAPVCGLILAYIFLFCREKKVGGLFLHAALVLFGAALAVVPFCRIFCGWARSTCSFTRASRTTSSTPPAEPPPETPSAGSPSSEAFSSFRVFLPPTGR